MTIWLQILINIIFSYIASVGFALIINVPHRALNFAGINGVVGWMVYWVSFQAHFGHAIPNLLAALALGIFSLLFARIKKCPVTVFNIPGLVPLVPGVPAYLAVRALLSGETATAVTMLIRVAVVTGAIAVGTLLATMLMERDYHLRRAWRHYKAR